MAHTGAARAGVINLTCTLALEWAPARVRVNAVAPGIIDSSGLERYPEPVRAALPFLTPEIPARRFGTEAEVAAAIVFLLSPASAYTSGVTLDVDGGSSIYRIPGFVLPDREPWPPFGGREK
jgi:citronellol/citronellal dehydrogenase